MVCKKTLADQVLEVGGRMNEAPSALIEENVFADEIASQNRLFQAVSFADIAHTLMQSRVGAIPSHSAAELMEALLHLHNIGACPDLDSSLGDVVTNREALLSERTSATAYLGASRARREAINTGFLIYIRKSILSVGKDLCKMLDTITAITSKHRSTIFPEYTYLRTAQATTFGHYLSSFAFPAERDLQRLRELYIRLNRCPAGCGSSNGSRLKQDRHLLSNLLGFDSPLEHARDAMWQADLPVELGSCLITIAVNISRLAEDLIVYSTNEFSLIELAERHCRASKIMPQKRNPFGLSYLRNVANHMLGIQVALIASGRTPSGQMDNRLEAYRELPFALSRVSGAVQLITEILDGIKINESSCRTKILDSFAFATDLAEGLALYSGIGFRDSHKVVGRLITHLDKTGKRFEAIDSIMINKISLEVLGKSLDVDEGILRGLISSDEAIHSRNVTGGAAPDRVQDMVEELAKRANSHSRWLSENMLKLEKAEGHLLKAAYNLAGSEL